MPLNLSRFSSPVRLTWWFCDDSEVMEDVAVTISPVSKESAMIVTFSGSCLGHKMSGIYIMEITITTVQR